MRTVSEDPAVGDLTGRARIIVSATEMFAAHGFRAATVRQIAAHAGVSPALVTHHFGGKAALRQECDARVLRFLAEKSRGDLSPAATLDAALRVFGPYLARMLSDDSADTSALFAGLMLLAEQAVTAGIATGTMRDSADPEALAAVLVVFGVAPFFVRAPLAAWAGGDVTDAISRLAGPIAEIYTHGLVTHEALTDATAEALRGGTQ
ncbi:MAG: TetR/AcrR family transcriptional regulator [Microbacterium sp.]